VRKVIGASARFAVADADDVANAKVARLAAVEEPLLDGGQHALRDCVTAARPADDDGVSSANQLCSFNGGDDLHALSVKAVTCCTDDIDFRETPSLERYALGLAPSSSTTQPAAVSGRAATSSRTTI